MNDLEKRLLELSEYGVPNLHCSRIDKHWSCNVEFSFKIDGVKTEVHSGYGFGTPLEAVKTVKEKIIEMVKQTEELSDLKQLKD